MENEKAIEDKEAAANAGVVTGADAGVATGAGAAPEVAAAPTPEARTEAAAVAEAAPPRNFGGEGRGDGRGRGRDRGGRDREPVDKEFVEKLVKLNRTAKVVKGGRRFSFSALTVIGDRKGNVGYGFGKANDVSEAIRKSVDKAKRNMIKLPVKNGTIPHSVIGNFKVSQIGRAHV